MRNSSAASAALFIALTGFGPPRDNGSSVIEACQARDASLPDFTFRADVAVAMHHFPWLHFHLQGYGLYDRGDRYTVHFTKMPWFAKQVHDIDLSMIDPALWAKNYSYVAIGSDAADTVFNLQPLHDPTLQKAQVALSDQGADWVDATYKDGMHIHMTVSPADIGGHILPSKLDVAIDYPHMPLSASADFNNYQFSGTTLGAQP